MTIKRSFIIGVLMALPLAGSPYAHAQQKEDRTPLQIEGDEKKKEAQAIDKQYKSTLERVRKNGTATQAPADPWQNMRGADDSKTKR